MRGFTEAWFRTLLFATTTCATHSKKHQGGIMKKLFVLVVLSLCMAASSFGDDVVGHSAKVAGKESYKAAKVSAKETAKAGKALVKFLF
jgi:hypothetical protein